MDDVSSAKLNNIIRYALAGGGLSAAATLLLNAFSETKDLSRRQKIEADIRNMARPQKVITLRAPMIKKKLEDLNVEDKDSAYESLSETKLASSAKESGISDYVGETLKWLAGVGGAAGGIYGANKLYNLLKQKALKQELEDAEAQYYTTLYMRKKLEDEAKKKELSGSSMYRFASEMEKEASTSAKILGGGTAALLAILLGSAYASRQLLNAKNPKLDHEDLYTSDLSAADLASPKLKFVIADEDITEDDLEELKSKYKTASVVTDMELLNSIDYSELFKSHVKEMVIKVAAALEIENQTNGGINNFINAVALGNIDNIKQAGDFESMCDLADDLAKDNVKVASEVNRALAINYIANDNKLSEVFVPYCAGELLLAAPTYDKMASAIDLPEAKEEFACILARTNIMENQELFKELDVVKTASESSFDFNMELEEFEQMQHLAIETALKDQRFN